MNKISEHITYKEAVNSVTATRMWLDNNPDTETLMRMIRLAEKVFEPLRVWYGKPIYISSFYRSKEVNKAIGGVMNSQHCKGEAMDIDTGDKEENLKLFNYIKDNLVFDQLIWEYSGEWVHVSYREGRNRNMAFDIK